MTRTCSLGTRVARARGEQFVAAKHRVEERDELELGEGVADADAGGRADGGETPRVADSSAAGAGRVFHNSVPPSKRNCFVGKSPEQYIYIGQRETPRIFSRAYLQQNRFWRSISAPEAPWALKFEVHIGPAR